LGRASPCFSCRKYTFRKLIEKQRISNSDTRRVSKKAKSFIESVIRDMTRQALRYNAVNLAQDFPDFPTPSRQTDTRGAANMV
jgi:hypothetical protein